MPLSVKDGMGAWIKDFQKSDAPQFKGKSDKERREMAMAAYLDAKKDQKDEGYVSMAQQRAVWATRKDGGKGHPDNKKKKNEATDKPPFTPDPPAPEKKNSDGTKTSPMSRAKQLAKMARDRNIKNEATVELEESPMVTYTVPNVTSDMASKLQKIAKEKKIEYSRKGRTVVLKGKRIDVTMLRTKMGLAQTNIPMVPVKEERQDTAHHIAKTLRKMGVRHDAKEHEILPKIPHALKKHGLHNNKVIKRDRDFQGDVIDSLRGMKESVEQIDEVGRMSPKVGKASYIAPAKELKAYAQKSGGMDKNDFMMIADMLEKLDRINILQAGQLLGQLNAKLKNMDTSPREKVLSVLHNHGHNVGNVMPGAKMRRESVEEASELDETQKLFMFKTKAEADKKAKEVKGKVVPLTKQNFAVVVEEAKYPHMMYCPKTGREVTAKTPADHNKYAKMGYTHDKPKNEAVTYHGNPNKDDDARNAARRKRLAKDKRNSYNEAKSFDQKFKDHLKFTMSKSPAVQAYMKKRVADRDAMNKKNDPNAAKKGYALSAVPPERKNIKLRKNKQKQQ